jgi:hypothetical protein
MEGSSTKGRTAWGGCDIMDPRRSEEEFERIKLHQDIARARLIVEQYETGMAYYRLEIENYRYRLGRLDERLGGSA